MSALKFGSVSICKNATAFGYSAMKNTSNCSLAGPVTTHSTGASKMILPPSLVNRCRKLFLYSVYASLPDMDLLLLGWSEGYDACSRKRIRFSIQIGSFRGRRLKESNCARLGSMDIGEQEKASLVRDFFCQIFIFFPFLFSVFASLRGCVGFCVSFLCDLFVRR